MLGVYLAMLNTDAQKQRFETLYYQNKSLMFQTAYRILNNKQNAEDAVHDAFVSAAKQIDKVMTMSDIQARNYLIIVVRNAAYRIYNQCKMESPVEEVYDGSDNVHTVELDVETKDFRERLRRLILAMDDKYRDVLILKYFYSMQDQEIAQALGISLENAKIRLHRAKNILKKQIMEEGLYDGDTV